MKRSSLQLSDCEQNLGVENIILRARLEKAWLSYIGE